jgi:hypothetical protein
MYTLHRGYSNLEGVIMEPCSPRAPDGKDAKGPTISSILKIANEVGLHVSIQKDSDWKTHEYSSLLLVTAQREPPFPAFDDPRVIY